MAAPHIGAGHGFKASGGVGVGDGQAQGVGGVGAQAQVDVLADVRLDVRGWDPGAVGARVVAEGATQRAEVVLDRASLAAWVEALRRVAAGERPDSMLAVGDVEVVVRTTGGAGR